MTARAEEPSEEGPPVCESCGPGKTVVFDPREVFKAPVRWRKPDWQSVGIKAAVVVGSLTLLDEPVRDYVQDHKGNTTERIANAFEPFGAEYAIGALAGFAAFGTLGGKPAARNVALDGTVSSLIAAGLVVPALKELTGRSRPNAGLGAHDFNPFSGAESFPSAIQLRRSRSRPRSPKITINAGSRAWPMVSRGSSAMRAWSMTPIGCRT